MCCALTHRGRGCMNIHFSFAADTSSLGGFMFKTWRLKRGKYDDWIQCLASLSLSPLWAQRSVVMHFEIWALPDTEEERCKLELHWCYDQEMNVFPLCVILFFFFFSSLLWSSLLLNANHECVSFYCMCALYFMRHWIHGAGRLFLLTK